MTFKRYQDETEEQYIYRIGNARKENNLTWEQVAEVINEELGESKGESAYRKRYKAMKDGYDMAVIDNVESDEVLEKLTVKKLELQKERNKMQAEKSEINKWIREQARTENIYDKVIEAVGNLQPIQVPEIKVKKKNNTDIQTLVIDIADAHFGRKCEIKGLLGETLELYSVEIFYDRMWELLERTVEIINKENIEFVTVLNLSDSIDGLIHTNQLLVAQMGVVESVMAFGEFMAQWLNKLSEYVTVDYHACLGNHSENRSLHSNRGDFKNENMEFIISWFLKSRLAANNNITIHDAQERVYLDILGTKILAVHGQYEKNLENSVKDYALIYNQPIHMLKTGHLHHGNTKTIASNGLRNIEIVQSPSICGVDDYAMTLKKTAKAGTFVTLFNTDGKVCTYDIVFKK